MDGTEIVTKHKESLIIWGIFCILAGCIFLVYASLSVAVGDGDIIMPLDDAYIHFQYGRQMALGEPYIYNSGDAPTSGATSFIYPYVLAFGHVLGFHQLNLGYWAMGIGALVLLASMWLIFRLMLIFNSAMWLAVIIASGFALTGSISWHFMSGMETGLMIAFSIATLYGFASKRFNFFWISAMLLAITRPEGSVMAIIAVLLYGGQTLIDLALGALFSSSIQRPQHKLWLLFVPLMACFVQPLVNFLITGSFSASGNQAKSILGIVPFYWDVVIERIVDNFMRMWREFATGTSGYYVPVIIAPFAFIGWISLLLKPKFRLTGTLLIVWLVVISGAIATLDTAFWHFKRYQMPLITLLFPLMGIGIIFVGNLIHRRIASGRMVRVLQVGVAVLLIVLSLSTGLEFLRLYHVNVTNVVVQPLAMARWLRENTPEDAVIAVHDVGMMRYMGERTTIDLVGLTTEGGADAWRNGPGAVAEFLMVHDPQPDYVASYTTARGLNYLADTPIYGELLAEFPAEFDPEDNVALAADYQGIYRYGLSAQYTPDTADPLIFMDAINIANLNSEGEHHYRWHDSVVMQGFATEVYELQYVPCSIGSCLFVDGGRRINGEESFTLRTIPNQSGILVTRVHPANRGTLTVYVNDELVDSNWIPEIPGRWLDIPTYIPAEHIHDETITVRIVVNTPNGHYMPYFHWFLQSENPPAQSIDAVVSYQGGAFTLSASTIFADSVLEVQLDYQTDGSAQGEYKVFVHVYGDDMNSEPLIQRDVYPVSDSLPPGNWLPGIFSDTIVLDLSELNSGTYAIAIGFYEPTTFERLLPNLLIDNGDYSVDEIGRRLFVGEVEIP